MPINFDFVSPSRPQAVHFDWLVQAAALPGKALHLAVALAWLAATGNSPGVSLTRRTLAKWSISRDACYDNLRSLQEAQLVRVWRLPGRAAHVILTEPGTDKPLLPMVSQP